MPCYHLKKHVSKCYEAKVAGIMTSEDITAFERGIALKDFTCLPAQLDILERNEEEKTSLVHITLKEGKFHQVKRMVAACGKEVIDLKRLTMGPLSLDTNLALGEYRALTNQERESLQVFGVDLD